MSKWDEEKLEALLSTWKDQAFQSYWKEGLSFPYVVEALEACRLETLPKWKVGDRVQVKRAGHIKDIGDVGIIIRFDIPSWPEYVQLLFPDGARYYFPHYSVELVPDRRKFGGDRRVKKTERG